MELIKIIALRFYSLTLNQEEYVLFTNMCKYEAISWEYVVLWY